MLRNKAHQVESEPQKQIVMTPSALVLNSINEMAALLDQDAQDDDRLSLMRHQQILANSLETLWRDVHAGRVSVDSIALLRALRDIARFDLSDQLQAPILQRMKITKELRVFENTIKQLICPTRIR
ncbi:MAG: hypothetical protein ACXABV_18005 [Candidatus Thorarchaeota archaeon]